MPPSAKVVPAEKFQLKDEGSDEPATFRYTASELVWPLVLSLRRTRVQPEGAVIVAVDGRTETAAIITSFALVPEGRPTLSTGVAGLSARMCVVPGSEFALPAAVAVFAPVAPATVCTA